MYSERHVQMKLRTLYSKEYIQDLHDLRPKSDSIMRSRLNTVRQSRNYRVSKSIRYSRVRLSSKIVSSRPSSVAASLEDTFKSFRNYNEPITNDLQDHLLKCTLPDSQPTSSILLMLDGSTASYSTKTDFAETPLCKICAFCGKSTCEFPVEPILHLNCGDECHERCLFELFEWPLYSTPTACPRCNAAFALNQDSGIDPRKILNPFQVIYYTYQYLERLRVTQKRKRAESDSSSNYPPTRILEGTEEKIVADSSSNLSSNNRQQSPGDGDLGKRLQNRSPSYVEHVTSVVRLSTSESFRTGSSLRRIASSLGRTMSSRSSWMSMSSGGSKPLTTESSRIPLQDADLQQPQGLINSGKRTFYRVAAPLLKGERALWNEIVDETKLLPAPESRPETLARAFLDRACPGELAPSDKSCECGFSIGWVHWDPDNGDCTAIDSLGNSRLHYAAFSGAATVPLIRSLLENGADIRARNVSGETFMHVLKTKKFIESQGMPKYITLLRLLSDLNFPFQQRDLHGRTIAHRLCEDGWLFCSAIREYTLSEFYETLSILNINMDALDNHGFNAGDEIQLAAERFIQQHASAAERFIQQHISSKSDTYFAVSKVKKLLLPHRWRGFLDVSFRKTLANSDWTSKSYIRWLQDDNLINWIDNHGDTPLTALLKSRRSEDQEVMLAIMIPELVELGIDINMRDRKGHTAVTIAAIRGSLPCVQALVTYGASIDIINYQGKDIATIASSRMKMAEQEGKTQCYAKILACLNFLMDIRVKDTPNSDVGMI
jgi:ankyrin repeat protein